MFRLLALLTVVASAAKPDLLHYRAGRPDLAAIQDGIAVALKLQPELFPEGLGDMDVVLYDTRDVYLYSQKQDYELPKVQRWRSYQIYKTSHSATLVHDQLQGCRVARDFVMAALDGKIPRKYLTCAPVTTFTALQKKRKGSIYDTRESYIATVVHEFGHLYQLAQPKTLPIVEEMAALLETRMPASSDLGARALGEAFATWAELSAAERVLPDHFTRMRADVRPASEEAHDIGLWLALQLKPVEAKPAD